VARDFWRKVLRAPSFALPPANPVLLKKQIVMRVTFACDRAHICLLNP
jgi:hypothetical protein